MRKLFLTSHDMEDIESGLKELPYIIQNGNLDTFLLQPINIIVNIGLSKTDFAAIGEIFFGFILIIYSGYIIQAPFFTFLLLLNSIIFILSLFIYLGSLSFFIKNPASIVRELRSLSLILSGQPNVGYNNVLKSVSFTILPVAFLSYFPIEFMRSLKYEYLIISFAGTFLFLIFSCLLFNFGLNKYETRNTFLLKY